MANEQAKLDSNSRATMLGVTDNAAAELRRLLVDPTTGRLKVTATISSGAVVGPVSSTDNAVARWDGTGGNTLQNSTVIIADTTGNISGVQKVTVGVAGSATGSIEIKGTTSGTVTLKTADAAGTYTLTLPTNDGDANQVLTTDGAGVLTWTTNGVGTVTDVSVVTANGVSGSVATSTTTPAITLTLGAITPSSVNGNIITTGTGTLTLGAGSTLATSATNSITLTSTGATNVTLPTTGTLATLAGTETLTNKTLTSPKLNEAVAVTATATQVNYLAAATGTTGTTSTNVVFSTSPTLVTPVLGVATVTTVNKVTITAPASSATLTIADGKTFTASNTLTFTGTDTSSVAFGGGGTVAYTNVTTLSSLVSVGTITTGTWDATTVAVTAGGTGIETATDGGVLVGNGTGAFQVTAVGTAGHVLTSNGAGSDPTFQAASATPQRSLNPQLNITNGQTAGGTSPTDLTSCNGVQCSMNADGGSSILKFNCIAVANWDFYDKNPDCTLNVAYTAGSATGTGNAWFGDSADVGPPPTVTQINKSMFVLYATSAGTLTISAVNADGATNTNATVTGVTVTGDVCWRIVKTSTTNIKYYADYVLKATNTTNLPSGDWGQTTWFTLGVNNAGGDTTTRTCKFGYFDVLLDSPTG